MLKGKLTYANVMSTLAVFLVLGGGAALAVGLAKNSVKSKQIKAGAVKNAELADNAVTSPKVANGSLLGKDFAAGQLPQGTTGPQGVQGIQGPTGPTLGVAENGFSPDALESSGVSPGAGSLEITTPSPGRIFGTVDAAGVIVNCTPDVSPVVGLYLDGQPLVGTRRNLSDNTAKDVHASSVSSVVAAGLHKLEIGAACGGASVPTFIGANDAERSLDAIFLGS